MIFPENPVALREAGRYILKNGFSPCYTEARNPNCGCFLHAMTEANPMINGSTILSELVGGLYENELRLHGWTGDEVRKDAAAACFIAADIAEASKREWNVVCDPTINILILGKETK